MTTMQQPVMGVIVLKCDPSWDECQKKQARAKAKALNDRCPLTRRKGISADDGEASSLRDLGNAGAKAFKMMCKDHMAGKTPKPRAWSKASTAPKGDDSDLADPCMNDDVKGGKMPKRKGRPNEDGWQADHIQDLQWGGGWAGPFWMMDSDVNESMGRQMGQKPNNNVDVATCFEIDC